jgi:hypothetical protein
MPHVIEAAASGRAACRTCKATIAKGDLRLGEEVANAFSDSGSYQWHHLPCAAKKKPLILAEALKATTMEVPNRAALEADIAANRMNQKPTTMPYAERAKTARSTCIGCNVVIDKDALRVAVEREVDTGTFVTKGAAYLHGRCAKVWIAENAPNPSLMDALTANSTSLSPADFVVLQTELG